MATLTNNSSDTVDTRRISTETKSSTKTTEFYAYVVAVVATVITSMVVGDDGHGDSFTGYDAMRLITYLTIGYMIARGIAKSGSRDYYDDDTRNNSSI
ncbi:MAG: hypothetical protein QOD35_3103 [Nocardioidaceae bacterium]|jgi:hypothetical protein|nr:hypothetical protein [Nocardioidaceae bacterium]